MMLCRKLQNRTGCLTRSPDQSPLMHELISENGEEGFSVYL